MLRKAHVALEAADKFRECLLFINEFMVCGFLLVEFFLELASDEFQTLPQHLELPIIDFLIFIFLIFIFVTI